MTLIIELVSDMAVVIYELANLDAFIDLSSFSSISSVRKHALIRAVVVFEKVPCILTDLS